MDFNNLQLNTILNIVIIILVYFIFRKFLHVYQQQELRKIECKEKELKLEELKIFSELSPEMAEKEIDALIDKYINDFVLDNIIVNNIEYMKKDNIDYMIKYITRTITVEISKLYLYYIEILVNIRNDEDLVKFIHKKVKQHVLEFVTNFNSAK